VDEPVNLHIERIQKQIDDLTSSLTDETDAIARMEAESHVRSLRLALAHFQLALQLEEEVRNAQNRTKRQGR